MGKEKNIYTYIYAMEYYSAIKKNGIMSLAGGKGWNCISSC
jgi:hypothetical protein